MWAQPLHPRVLSSQAELAPSAHHHLAGPKRGRQQLAPWPHQRAGQEQLRRLQPTPLPPLLVVLAATRDASPSLSHQHQPLQKQRCCYQAKKPALPAGAYSR